MDRGGGQSEQERNLYAAAASASEAGWLAMADKGKAAACGDSVLRFSVNAEVFTWCGVLLPPRSKASLGSRRRREKGVEGASGSVELFELREAVIVFTAFQRGPSLDCRQLCALCRTVGSSFLLSDAPKS
jgi:hypothetical protein